MNAPLEGPLVDREPGLQWLDGEGPMSDVVISTRVRLARNLRPTPFPKHSSQDQQRAVLATVAAATERSSLMKDARRYLYEDLSRRERNVLMERRLASRELFGHEAWDHESSSAVIASVDHPLSVMINEEDHLRIQSVVSGLRAGTALELVDQLDDELGAQLPFAFHPRLGYLTHCPTNLGTGLRVSALMHLPGLAVTHALAAAVSDARKIGLEVRGLYGEGSSQVGLLFQLSNRRSLGTSEDDVKNSTQGFARLLAYRERKARETVSRDALGAAEDKVWRALGILRHARSLSHGEFLRLLSGVRFGVALRILPPFPSSLLNELMVFTMDAHLDLLAGQRLDREDRPSARAHIVRDLLREYDEVEDAK